MNDNDAAPVAAVEPGANDGSVTPEKYDQGDFMLGVTDMAKKYARMIGYNANPILSDLCANLLGIAMAAEAEDLFPQIMSKAQKQAETLIKNREIIKKVALLRETIPEGRA